MFSDKVKGETMNKFVKNALIFASGACGGVVAGGLLVIDLALQSKNIRDGVTNAIKEKISDALFGKETIYRSRTSRIWYDKPVFDTERDAELTLARMAEIIDTYGHVTVADLYDLIDIDSTYADNLRGWVNVRNVEIIKTDVGYILNLSHPMRLK